MSRCFPYPPPGCTLSRDRKEDLVESIKLQKDQKKSKKGKVKGTEKQRRHKEKRDDRKNKKNEMRNQMFPKSDFPIGQIGRDMCAKNEQLQESNLTEEHKEPNCLWAPSISSDSTDNSNKRKRPFSLMNGNCGRGTILKICLPSAKLKPAVASVTEQICSTSGRIDILSQEKVELDLKHRQENERCQSAETSKYVRGFTFRTDKELIGATSQMIDVTLARKRTSSVLHAIEAAKQSEKYLQYTNMNENWVPTQLNNTLPDPEDLDWLLSSKIQGKPSEKRQKSEYDTLPCSRGSSMLQPRALYLREADAFALPFAIPF